MSFENDSIGSIVLTLLLIGGLGVLGWQAYEYLRFGIWMPVSIITALEWMEIQWAYFPTDWAGLHKLLKIIPLSAALIASAWIVIMIDN